MKLFEVEIPEGEENKDIKKDGEQVDFAQILPFADGAEKYRGRLSFLPW